MITTATHQRIPKFEGPSVRVVKDDGGLDPSPLGRGGERSGATCALTRAIARIEATARQRGCSSRVAAACANVTCISGVSPRQSARTGVTAGDAPLCGAR
jgi:hypothetical protein